MSPYIGHLVVAEQVYAQLWTQDDHLGEFLYGSIIPDISAEPNELSRWDTHFVGPYSESGQAVFSQGTTTFLGRYQTFTTRPPRAWNADDQAFLEGYLCHLTVDEMWRALLIPLWLARRERFTRGHIHTLMTVFDHRAAQRLQNPDQVCQALRASARIDILDFLDPDQGEAFKHRVCDAVAAGGGIEAFLELARGAGESESWVQERQREFLEHRDQIERLLEDLPADSFFSSAVERSLEMIERFRQSLP